MERVTRIELAPSAWKAEALPLSYTRVRSFKPRPEHYSASSTALAPTSKLSAPQRTAEHRWAT